MEAMKQCGADEHKLVEWLSSQQHGVVRYDFYGDMDEPCDGCYDVSGNPCTTSF